MFGAVPVLARRLLLFLITCGEKAEPSLHCIGIINYTFCFLYFTKPAVFFETLLNEPVAVSTEGGDEGEVSDEDGVVEDDEEIIPIGDTVRSQGDGMGRTFPFLLDVLALQLREPLFHQGADLRSVVVGDEIRAPEMDAWLDCGKPETLLETNRYLLSGRHHIHGEAVNSEPVHIEKGAVLRNSVIGPHVSIAAGTVIEHSVIRESIVNSNSEVFNMVLHHSILGDHIPLTGASRRLNIGDHSIIDMEA